MWNAVLSIASFLGIRKRDEPNEPVAAAPSRKRPRKEDASRRETDDDADGYADAAAQDAFLSRDANRSVNRPQTAVSWEKAQSSLHLVQFAPGVAPASTTPRYMWQDGRYKLVTPPRAKKQGSTTAAAAAAAVQPSARSLLQSLAIISQQPQRSAHAGPFSLYSRPRPARRRAASPGKQQKQQRQRQQQYRELEPLATWLTPPSPRDLQQQQQQHRQNSLFGGTPVADWQDQKSVAVAAAAAAKHAELQQQEQQQQQRQQQQQQISTAAAATALRATAVSTGAAADSAVDLVSSSDDAASRSRQPGALSTAAVSTDAAATAADGAANSYGDGHYSSSSGSSSEEESDDAAAAANAAAADVWDDEVEQQFSVEEVTALKAAWSTAADATEVSIVHIFTLLTHYSSIPLTLC
jgi:hypothetical protein